MTMIIFILSTLILITVFVFGVLFGQIITYKHVEELNKMYKSKGDF